MSRRINLIQSDSRNKGIKVRNTLGGGIPGNSVLTSQRYRRRKALVGLIGYVEKFALYPAG